MTPSDQSGHEQSALGQQGHMQDEAIQWLLRQRADEMDADQWEQFTLWLEADPRHAEAFDAAVDADKSLDGLPDIDIQPHSPASEIPAAANDNPLSRFVPWAMASAAAVLLAVFTFAPSGDPTLSVIATAPGERQVIALTDEITMTLNGSSEVTVEQGRPNVSIARGEVAFAIDADDPSALRVEVGGLTLTDYGTVFNVLANDELVSVAVAEGIVAINPDLEDIQINAGEIAEQRIGEATLTRRPIAAETVATWRVGRLEFDDTPIADALAQVERSTGVTIAIDNRFADARLTGSIIIPEDEAEVVAALAAFLGGSVRQSGELWLIE